MKIKREQTFRVLFTFASSALSESLEQANSRDKFQLACFQLSWLASSFVRALHRYIAEVGVQIPASPNFSCFLFETAWTELIKASLTAMILFAFISSFRDPNIWMKLIYSSFYLYYNESKNLSLFNTSRLKYFWSPNAFCPKYQKAKSF